MASSMSIKGTREGLTITLGDEELGAMLQNLGRHLGMQEAFFRGGTVALQVGQRALSVEDLARIRDLLTEHQMILRTVVSANAQTGQAAQALGLRSLSDSIAMEPVEGGEPREMPSPRIAHGTLEGTRGTLVHHIVRSGQTVRHTGHVVVLGDVNAGAEIVAGGDIVIWGGLYGTAHAGAMGDTSAIICALDMSPLQLRIGELVARPEEGDPRKPVAPEMASVRGDRIVVELWQKVRGV
jgi:septum site-determining protein MinC